MILYRCFAWNRRADASAPDGALFFARTFQGRGRHDNPETYGCLYLADREISSIVEQLAPFRGLPLRPSLLVRRGLPLALAAIELPDRARLVDLDEPSVLAAHELRPSLVATRRRELTQSQALKIFRRHSRSAGIRWWSVFESLWANVTLFDRASDSLAVVDIRRLAPEDAAVLSAAEALGLAV